MATPLTLGQVPRRFAFHLYQELPALQMGLSVLPPPATRPIMARHDPGMVVLVPEGRRTRVFFWSSEWPMMIAEQPEARAKEPRSPVLASQLETMVPSGRELTGKILPTESAAIK